MSEDGQIPIRSYRLCFALQRRIHHIDRWRIPVPYGLPLVGIAYAAGTLVAILMLARLPLLGPVIGVVHPALRLVVAPCLAAALLTRIEVDGRRAHAHLAAVARSRAAPQWVAGFRRIAGPGASYLDDIEFAPDMQGARLRAAVIEGPCELTVRYPARMKVRGARLKLTQTGDSALWQARTIRVAKRGRVVVR